LVHIFFNLDLFLSAVISVCGWGAIMYWGSKKNG